MEHKLYLIGYRYSHYRVFLELSTMEMDQGWILVGLSALTTLLGCFVIFTDVVYKWLMPARYSKHPFHINNDTNFLTCSLALSSGCLIFTSLYKLLPKAASYLKSIPKLKHDKRLLSATEFSFYFGGIVACSLLNLIIHMLTSESLVHCAHDGEGHQHHATVDSELGNGHADHHTHSHDNHDHESQIDQLPVDSVKVTEISTHAPPNGPTKAVSLLDMSIKALKGKNFQGDCYGDWDACASDIVNRSKNFPDEHNDHSKLHFCTRPTDDNLLFIGDDDQHLITNKSEFHIRYPSVDLHSPLIDYHDSGSTKDAGYGSIKSNNIDAQSHTGHDHGHGHGHGHDHDHVFIHDVSLDDALDEEDDGHHERHHHHIKTPFSRLLSIGIQTIVAITFHKFPEGFIMYATSKANPDLGLMIFISMFIHNFVEGFTMTLPIYVAIGSRWKAILISGVLGSLAQPIGAFLGWLTFRGGMDMDDNFSVFLIGGLIALTSGFLTFISLQMFASAIGFGGKQERVMRWCFYGIFLICLSSALI